MTATEKGNGRRFFSSVSFVTCSQCQIPFCYTGRLLSRRGIAPCRAIRVSVVTDRVCENKFVPNAYPRRCRDVNSRSGLRGTVMPRLRRRLSGLCSRTLSDPVNRLRKTRKKNPLPYSFSMRSHIGNLPDSQGKVGFKRKENRRLSFTLPPRRAPRSAVRRRRIPAEVQRKTPRPLGANTPAAVRVPRWSRCRKRSRPVRANTLTQFARPGQPVLKKLPPRSGEHACGSSSAPLDFTLISYYTEKAKYVVPTTKQEEI